MLDKEQTAQTVTDEKEKQAYYDTIIGLYCEALDEIEAHEDELDEITEQFTKTLGYKKDAPFTGLFKAFFLGVGKGLELVDRIESL